MANWTNEAEAREQIKTLVAEYYHDLRNRWKVRKILNLAIE